MRAAAILLVFAAWFFLLRAGAPARQASTYNRAELLAVQQQTLALSNPETQFPEAAAEPSNEQENNEKYLRIFGTNYDATKLTELEGTPDINTLKDYGREIKTALAPFTNPNRANEVETALLILDKGSAANAAAELATLNALRQEYDAATSSLAAIRVPADATEPHLALVNIIARLGQLTANMQEILTDPIRAIASAQEFARGQRDLIAAYEAINAYFTAAGVTFTPSESATLTIYEIR